MIALLLALAVDFAPGDLSWVPDAELAQRATVARSQAASLETKAADADRLRATIEEQRAREAEEKASVEASLPTLKGTKKSLAESRLKELAANLATREKRIADLTREAAGHRANAQAQRAHATQLAAETGKRKKESAARLTDAEVETLTEIPSRRLLEAKAYHELEKARFAKQIAALDGMLQGSRDPGATAAVIASKNDVRIRSGTNDIALERLGEELREREGAMDDEARRLAELEAASKARREDEASEVETEEERAAHSKSIDAVLDGIIAREDAAKARAEERRRTVRTTMRLSILGLFLVGGIAAVWYAVRRK